MIVDFHTHTTASIDGRSSVRKMVEAACAKGLQKICITDHMDYLHIDDITAFGMACKGVSNEELKNFMVCHGEFCYFIVDYAAHIEEIRKIAEEYEGRIEVLLGAEVGLNQDFRSELEAFSMSMPFDFIIGSQHSIRGRDINQDRERIFAEGKLRAYVGYIEEMITNVSTFDGFDVYGHIDYIARYAPFEDTKVYVWEVGEVLEEFFKVLIRRGKGIEVNTSGLRYGLGYVHPHIDILKMYRELGGEIITIGSDAHRTEHVGANLHEALAVLREAGFSSYTIFKQRKPEWVRI